MIQNLNELSDKFGYTIKTFNLLGVALMIQGEYDKAQKIFENAVNESSVFELIESDPSNSLFAASNFDLQCLIMNYVKCNLTLNGYGGMVQDSYKEGGLQVFLK